MKHFNRWLIHIVVVLFSVFPSLAMAGDGHDHGEAPAAAGPALPRFTAVSESFELVGVINGKQLLLYLDHFADGSPVKNAKLELELGGVKVAVEPHADGEFEAALPAILKPGTLAIAATVLAGEESDLLAGELDLHGESTHAENPASHKELPEYLIWIGAASGLLALLFFGFRRWRRARHSMFGGTV